MKIVNETVSSIATSVEKQNITTNDISAQISEVASSIRNVAEEVDHCASSSGEMAERVGSVGHISRQNKINSEEVADAGNNLADLSTQLNTIVDQFDMPNTPTDGEAAA